MPPCLDLCYSKIYQDIPNIFLFLAWNTYHIPPELTLWFHPDLYSKVLLSKRLTLTIFKRAPAQAGCMRQVLGPGALGRPRGIRWRGRWEGRSGWGTHVYPWLIHVNVWQKPLQYCKVISLQLIKINEKKKRACSILLSPLTVLYFSS